MPRNGQGVYSLPPVYEAVTGETIEAQSHNVPLEDIAADLNAPRSVATGGTGGASATAARNNLEVYSKTETDQAIEDALDTGIGGAATKETPVDDDGVIIADSEAENVTKRVLWSRVKAVLKSYFDTLYLGLGGGILTGGLRVNSTAGIIVDAETGLRLRGAGLKQIAFQNADGSANTGLIQNAETGGFVVVPITGGTTRAFTFGTDGKLTLPVTSSNPTDAVRKDDLTARITEVNNTIAGRAIRDWITTVGLVGNDPNRPYVRQESTGGILEMQRALGFTPSRQIGGNIVGFQWSGGSLNINIDNGGYTSQIVDSNNFLAWLNNQAVMRQNNYNYTLGAGAGAGAGQVCLIANMNSSGDALSVRDRGSEKGSVRMTTTATQFNTSSDYRLKSDVAPLVSFTLTSEQFDLLDTNLLRIMLLRPVSYRWNVEPDQIAHGFIAHEMQEVMPHAVSGQKDAVKRLGRATVRGPLIMPEYATGDVVKEVQSAVYGPSIVYEGVKEDDYPGADWEYTHTVPEYQQIDNSKVVADLTASVQSLTLMVLEQDRQIKDLQQQLPSD